MITDKEATISMYKNMLSYYIENVGEVSEIANTRITPRMIILCVERIYELGGRIPSEEYEICWEGLETM